MAEQKQNSSPSRRLEFVPKLWIVLKNGYSFAYFKSDFIAGITVSIIALPLSMAFAIASGVDPVRGLYASIVAGILISAFGGSYSLIGGPAGAFIVVVYNIVQEHGYDGLMIVTFLAGIILLIAAFTRVGNLMKYVPYPLVIGFTSGIAITIFSTQVKDFFGLTINPYPSEFIPKSTAILSSFSTINWATFYVAISSLVLIILVKKFLPILPWAITAIVSAAIVCKIFNLPVETIATRYGQIPRTLPPFGFPEINHKLGHWHMLIPQAMTIAFLIGISSLLAALVADGMTGRTHKSNCELMGEGIANLVVTFFGGIPATGAIARTAANIKAGGKTPIAGIIHSIVLIAIILVFAPWVSQVPLASLSAVLMMVSWNMSQAYHFKHLFKAPRGDVIILLTTFLLTIFVDLTVGVGVGMVVAAFVFIKRVGESSKIVPFEGDQFYEDDEHNKETIEHKKLPHGVEIYEISGPFFFGLADSLKDVLNELEFKPKVFILKMKNVPTIDATGMHSLKEFYFKCRRDKTQLILFGPRDNVLESLDKYGFLDLVGTQMIYQNFDEALKKSREIVSS